MSTKKILRIKKEKNHIAFNKSHTCSHYLLFVFTYESLSSFTTILIISIIIYRFIYFSRVSMIVCIKRGIIFFYNLLINYFEFVLYYQNDENFNHTS